MCQERIILPPSMVWMSIDITLKDLPPCDAPKNSPDGVPVASPRTVTVLPATSTSLISHFRSGTDFSRAATPAMTSSRLLQASLPRHDTQPGAVACRISSALLGGNGAFSALWNRAVAEGGASGVIAG